MDKDSCFGWRKNGKNMRKTFAMTGAAGYVAQRHMQAIKDTGNDLIAVLDPHDALGILERYHPNAYCFSTENNLEAFLREHPVDYLTICSPNHLHFEHIALGLRCGANIICEKPLVIQPDQLDALLALRQIHQRAIHTILQLRLLPSVQLLQKVISESDAYHQVEVRYITSRGKWYHHSWKGQDQLSGGLITNIGIHLFDLLLWLFGPLERAELIYKTKEFVNGKLYLRKAEVNWTLSTDPSRLPESAKEQGKKTFREINIDGQELRLDEGLEELHTKCYQEILMGKGPGINEAAPSILLCHLLVNL
jgi:UDP-N-acetyl-2-amino-2-deoxyglucuronate dehydrogenase